MDKLAHLNEDAKAALDLSDAERIRKIGSPKWILHDRVKMILEALESLLVAEKSTRMKNLLIWGDSGSGKTMVLQEFWKRHPASLNRSTGITNVPVFYMTCPPTSNEAALYATMLDRLSSFYGSPRDVHRLQSQLLHTFRQAGVRMLLLDELHDLVNDSVAKQRHMLKVLKYLSIELQVPIVAAGTKEALHIVKSEPQVDTRFKKEQLPRWTMGPDYLRLLMSFEQRIPLRKPSLLHSKELATQLLVMSGGYIGEISHLLVAAAEAAVREGSEQITLPLLKNLRDTVLVGKSELIV